jgi:hypothetical protein
MRPTGSTLYHPCGYNAFASGETNVIKFYQPLAQHSGPLQAGDRVWWVPDSADPLVDDCAGTSPVASTWESKGQCYHAYEGTLILGIDAFCSHSLVDDAKNEVNR